MFRFEICSDPFNDVINRHHSQDISLVQILISYLIWKFEGCKPLSLHAYYIAEKVHARRFKVKYWNELKSMWIFPELAFLILIFSWFRVLKSHNFKDSSVVCICKVNFTFLYSKSIRYHKVPFHFRSIWRAHCMIFKYFIFPFNPFFILCLFT